MSAVRTAIGTFGGARLADLLTLVGADTRARFVEVGCLDDYYSSLDMASCLHPQTLACYEMYGRPLTAGSLSRSRAEVSPGD